MIQLVTRSHIYVDKQAILFFNTIATDDAKVFASSQYIYKMHMKHLTHLNNRPIQYLEQITV